MYAEKQHAASLYLGFSSQAQARQLHARAEGTDRPTSNDSHLRHAPRRRYVWVVPGRQRGQGDCGELVRFQQMYAFTCTPKLL